METCLMLIVLYCALGLLSILVMPREFFDKYNVIDKAEDIVILVVLWPSTLGEAITLRSSKYQSARNRRQR